jgi:pantoate kinase
VGGSVGVGVRVGRGVRVAVGPSVGITTVGSEPQAARASSRVRMRQPWSSRCMEDIITNFFGAGFVCFLQPTALTEQHGK